MNATNIIESAIAIILAIVFILWLMRRNKKDEEEDL